MHELQIRTTALHFITYQNNDDPRMVDLIFLYNKNTTKVKISQYNLESSKIDLAKIAKEEASEDEEEVIGLKNADFDQEIEDEEELK